MAIRLRPVLSVCTIGIFLCFAVASDLLNESTNTNVKVEGCEAKPPFSGNLRVEIEYVDFDGKPMANFDGKIYITNQIVDPPDSCTTSVLWNINTGFIFDVNGKFVYGDFPFTHSNKQDLFRIEVIVPEDEDAGTQGFRKVYVARYNQEFVKIFKREPEFL